jgi:hypothetical protein
MRRELNGIVFQCLFESIQNCHRKEQSHASNRNAEYSNYARKSNKTSFLQRGSKAMGKIDESEK